MLLINFQRIAPVVPLVLALLFATVGLAPIPSQTPKSTMPVFPGAQGFGSKTPAGRGGQIIKVTNLKDRGAGSLRAAIETSGPRIIVFEVGGTISLSRELVLDNPYATIAGQTAPSPGILLKGAGIRIRTHDILIQHLRIRVGDGLEGSPPGNRDALEILGPNTYNVVVDHISASWAIDENASTWYPVHDITISNSIFSEGLNASLHPKGPHSKGILIGDHARNISLIGNLMAHNAKRNPRVSGDVSLLVANNVMYNCGGTHFMSIGSSSGPSAVTIIGNVFILGPNTSHRTRAVKVEAESPEGTAVYFTDNRTASSAPDYSTPYDPRVPSPPIWISSLSIRESSAVEAWVLSGAGARRADHDSVDERIVNEVVRRTGRIIDSQSQVGGWPGNSKTMRPFPVPAHPNRDDDGDGYTNIEEILHLMAAEVERGSANKIIKPRVL